MGSNEGDSCGGCCCCCCFCVKGLFPFFFGVGFIVLIYWAIFQPHHIHATVDSATLSNLTVVVSNSGNASSSSSSAAAEISYRLAVDLNLYNPSVRVNIYYDAIDARLRFRDAVLGPAANGTSPAEFYQRRKTGDSVKLEFDYGRSPGVAVAADVAGELQKEMGGGGGAPSAAVRLELDVDLQVRYVFRIFKLRQKPRVWCELSIPVKAEGPGPAVGGAVASGERCRVKY